MSRSSSIPDSAADLLDEITNYKNMLQVELQSPLGPDPETVGFYERHIRGLKKRVPASTPPSASSRTSHLKEEKEHNSRPPTQPSPSLERRPAYFNIEHPSSSPSLFVRRPPPQFKIEDFSRSSSSNSVASTLESWSEMPSSHDSDIRSPLFTLSDRKRGLDLLEAEFPESKSLRHTPDASPAYTGAPSPAITNESSDYDVNDLREIIGDDWMESHKHTQVYYAKKKQEEDDTAIARSMQLSFPTFRVGSAFGQNRAQTSGSSKQTFLNSNGSLQRPMAPPPPASIKQERLQPNHFTNYNHLPQSPLSISSDSDIEEIDSSQFFQSVRIPPHEGRGIMPQPGRFHESSHNNFLDFPSIPGSFPDSSPFEGLGGSSVYNQNYFDLTLSLPQPSPFSENIAFGGRPAGLPGSSSTPIDLEDGGYRDGVVKSDEEIKALLQHIRPDEEMDPEDRPPTPEQMRIELMPHQRLGLGWMQKMEDGTNKGGILADDMGLGKTMQALALIVSRPAAEGEPRPNLIVAPVSLLIQWAMEAEKAMRPHHYRLKVFILHGETRRTPWRVLRDYDIILTTYGTLASELKRKIAWQEVVKLAPDTRPTAKDEFSILGDKCRFHRVFLDEAQNIKNKSTKAALAACEVQAQYRWCLTGTPMQNRVEELYSLIKFCRIKPYNHAETFSIHFTRPLKSSFRRDKAMRLLQVLCKAILLRRTKTSKIDGRPILDLLPKTTEEARAVLSTDERDFYKALADRTIIQFNRYLNAGTVGRNYSNILVLLLRLRQACCHPHLIKDIEINTGGVEGLDLVENARDLSQTVVDRLRLEEDAPECPICMDVTQNPLILAPCGHSLCEECLGKLVDQAATEEGANVKCPHCRGKLDTAKTTDHQSFLRVFCPEREGVEPLTDNDASGSDDSSDESDDDDDDGEDLKDFIVPNNVVEYDTDEKEEKYRPGKTPFERSKKGSAGDMKEKKNSKGKGKAKPHKSKDSKKSLAQLRKEGLRNKSAKKAYLKRLEEKYVPSAKLLKTEALLDEIHGRGTGEKTIIFSAFTSFLDMLEVPLSRRSELGSYVRYDGSMTSRDRNDAVVNFSSKPNVRMMLVSMKAGNAGLNLTAANNVIILDPHWNPYVEMQCQDRAHRIGQMRPVNVYRILIDPEGLPERAEGATVEDRILTLQESKRKMVDSALDENAGSGLARLGARELGFLFGVNSL